MGTPEPGCPGRKHQVVLKPRGHLIPAGPAPRPGLRQGAELQAQRLGPHTGRGEASGRATSKADGALPAGEQESNWEVGFPRRGETDSRAEAWRSAELWGGGPGSPGPQLLLLSRDTTSTQDHPRSGQDHEVPRSSPLRATRHQAQAGSSAALRPRSETRSHSPSWLKRPWLKLPTKVSFLGSDLARAGASWSESTASR